VLFVAMMDLLMEKNINNYLVVDVSNKTKDVFHYLLAKPVVLQIANQYSNNNNTKQGNETEATLPLSSNSN
jgi:hypothetical protein